MPLMIADIASSDEHPPNLLVLGCQIILSIWWVCLYVFKILFEGQVARRTMREPDE